MKITFGKLQTIILSIILASRLGTEHDYDIWHQNFKFLLQLTSNHDWSARLFLEIQSETLCRENHSTANRYLFPLIWLVLGWTSWGKEFEDK